MDSFSHETPQQIAQHVLALADAGAPMEALLSFQQWIFAVQQEAPLHAAWVSLTPLLQACMWLKQNGGALGLAIILRTEVIPMGLRHLLLNGDSPTATTASSESRSEFLVDSTAHLRLGCHDFYEADKNEYSEINVMAHNDWVYDALSWHIQVRSDGSLVFRNSNPTWKEMVLRGPVRDHDVYGKNVVLAAMPLDMDAVHTWEVCVTVDEATRNDPDSIKNQLMLKCVGATSDCFLDASLTDEAQRDSQSYYVFFQEYDRFESGDVPGWRIQQAGFDQSREKVQACTRRLLNYTTFNAELMQQGLELMHSAFYDIVEHAELMVALARMYTMGAITANKLGKATELLSPAIKLYMFHMDTCLDPKARHDLAAFEELKQKKQKIDETITMLSAKASPKDDTIDTVD